MSCANARSITGSPTGWIGSSPSLTETRHSDKEKTHWGFNADLSTHLSEWPLSFPTNHTPLNQRVPGSSPGAPTKQKSFFLPMASQDKGRERDGSHATFFVVGRGTARSLLTILALLTLPYPIPRRPAKRFSYRCVRLMESPAPHPRTSQPIDSRPDAPAAQWTGAHKGHAFLADANNDLIDLKAAIIVDVEATRAIRQAEVGATCTMIERTEERLELCPERIVADRAMGRRRCWASWSRNGRSSPTFRCSTNRPGPTAPSRAETCL